MNYTEIDEYKPEIKSVIHYDLNKEAYTQVYSCTCNDCNYCFDKCKHNGYCNFIPKADWHWLVYLGLIALCIAIYVICIYFSTTLIF